MKKLLGKMSLYYKLALVFALVATVHISYPDIVGAKGNAERTDLAIFLHQKHREYY